MNWSDDVELVATFRAEVDDRLASLRDGLLGLEADPAPRRRIDALMRDAHTVKGSGRMLGLDRLVGLAHRAEDLLGHVLHGRLPVSTDLVSLLLATADGLGRCLPGASSPLDDAAAEALVSALDAASAGEGAIVVPRTSQAPADSSSRLDDDLASPVGAATHGLQMQRFVATVPIKVAMDAPCTVILVKQTLPFSAFETLPDHLA